MTDNTGDGPLGEGPLGEELLDELDNWDKMFDQLHEGAEAAPGSAPAVDPHIETTAPGARAPVLPPEPDAVAAAAAVPAPEPTRPKPESDPFPVRSDDLQLEGEPRALGALLGHRSKRSTAAGDEPDDGLYTSAPRLVPKTAKPMPPKGSVRRGPAIIRRDKPTRPGIPINSMGAEEDDTAGSTVSPEVQERLAESAEALFRAAPPDVDINLHEDFYDDIEVAAKDAPTSSDRLPALDDEDRLPTMEPTQRRTTRHVVRRERERARGETAPRPRAVQEVAAQEDESGASAVGEPLAEESFADVSLDDVEAAAAEASAEEAPAAAIADAVPAAVPVEVTPGARARMATPPAMPKLPPLTPVSSASGPLPGASATAVPAPPPTDADIDVDIDDSELVEEAAAERARADGEVDAALDDAVAISDGTLAPPQLADVDVPPDLPPAKFPDAPPAIDLAALVVADVEPSPEDRTEALARDLVLYERELAMMDEPGRTARLRMEAGRLAERLGDLDRARTHYDGALQLDPRLRPPLRALRRVERALGNFGEAVRHLDAEIELASAMEKRALQAYRADLLIATGEHDVARVAVGALLDDAPADVRSLLANLELAWVDGRHEEVDSSLQRLAQAVADDGLAAALLRARGLLAQAQATDSGPVLREALERSPADRGAWLGLAPGAAARGEHRAAADALDGLIAQGGLAEAAPALAGAFEWRRADALARSGAPGDELDASLERAAERLPEDRSLVLTRAHLLIARGQQAAAAVELERVASGGGAEWAARHAARLLDGAGDRPGAIAVLRRAVERDPGEALAAAQLAELLEAASDQDALNALDRAAINADTRAVLPRIRLARRLESMERRDEAIEVLENARTAGVRSAALDAQLAGTYERGGRMGERAHLALRQVEEKASYVDMLVAQRVAAAALEAIARGGPVSGAALAAAERWDDHGGDGALAGAAGEDVEVPMDDEDGAVPEPVFGPPSARIEQGSGPASGTWREPVSAPNRVVAAALRDPARAEAAALAAWRRVLELDPDSGPARAAALRLVERRGKAGDVLEVLEALQRSPAQPAVTVPIALRRAELLLSDHDRDGAEKVLRAGAALDPDDPRCHLSLLRLLAEDIRWEDAADLLNERADQLGERDEAISLRYRAAGLLLDKTEEIRLAVELLTPIVAARPDFLIASDLIRAAQRRLGDAAPAEGGTIPPPVAPGPRGQDDTFVRLVREAESIELADPARASELYSQALAAHPEDPLARDGFARAALRAGETAPLTDMALVDLRRAETMADGAAKATAYEELARIDADLRGDLNSAILGWESAVESDPGRISALRSLERAYLAGSHDRELLRVYERLLPALEEQRDQLAVLIEQGRLAVKAGRPREEILDLFRRLLEIDPQNRMALFRLESAARTEGPSLQLAELERAVARFFASDARAQAAFLTRAGETLRSVGDGSQAIASFRAAVAALPGYAPALAGWRDAAVAGEMWQDVADVAEREAESAVLDEERARLYHVAGVVLMDRSVSEERAVGALRRVLDIDPAHRDAFLRLKLLYEEMGRDLELVELYRARLAVEKDRHMQAVLHQGLAGLYRNFFDDREAARNHLQAALEIEPGNLRLVADLSDIAWELGDWASAAEALIARAGLETRPKVLRTIFYRLGTIYADRMPDARYAMMSFQKVLTYDPNDIGALERIADLAASGGDYRLALGACEHLIKQTRSDADKVPHLHRVARIYLEGFQDRQRAERALRVALDLDPTSDVALSALVGFYRDAGDARSARVHLDRVLGAMRQRLEVDPTQVRPYQVMARAFEAREAAGVAGSLAAARCAAEIAVLFGSDDQRDAELAASAASTRTPLGGIGVAEVDDMLFPAVASSSLRALFRLLGERFAKHAGTDVRRYGVGRGERLRKGSDPMAGAILELAAEMGIDDVDIYISPKQATVLAAEPTSPVSLVLGSQLASLDRPAELRFLVARALKLALASLPVPARQAPEEMGVMLGGLLRLFATEFEPRGLDPAQVAGEQQKWRRLIPSQMFQELAPYAMGIASHDFDYRAVWTGIIAGGNRAGLLAAGSVHAALVAVLRLGGYRDIHQGVGDPFVVDLLRFAVSEDHAALRGQLGG
ncbi:MAG TPA: hypothetical protein VMZ28_17255 [Kofleriaceae bacterium]|nr:hypothetical protein [Kofleriaceae bacterium]